MTSRSRARRRFIADQAQAAAVDVEHHVTSAAARAGQQLTELDGRAPMSDDPLAAWFIRAYVRMTSGPHATCDHLSDSAPQPQRWDSAVPRLLVCEARCTGPGFDLQLRAQGHLPARCGRCGTAPATLHVRIALAETIIIGRVCARCMATHSPAGGGAA
jgi:hypothetical protein